MVLFASGGLIGWLYSLVPRPREVIEMTHLLEVGGVSKRFGGLQAVSNVSFTIQEREILGLIGPNGAGKTTLFNMVNGVYKPDTGQNHLCGRETSPAVARQSGTLRAGCVPTRS